MSISGRLRALDDRAVGWLSRIGVGRRLLAWSGRPSVRRLRAEVRDDTDFERDRDARRNDETRLSANDSVNHAGVMILEAFTPSTVNALRRRLEALPESAKGKREGLDFLATARTRAGAWSSLGQVRPRASFSLFPQAADDSLPPGVDAVSLGVHYALPSVAIVTATFTFDDATGELSQLLRADYRSETFDHQMRIDGPLGLVQKRIPWSRPKRASTGYSFRDAAEAKRMAVEGAMRRREDACRRWFNANWRGRFALESADRQPMARILLTSEEVPFTGQNAAIGLVEIDHAGRGVWQATETKGWFLSFRRPFRDRAFRATFAARRVDLERIRDSRTDEEAIQNWSIAQSFDRQQSPLLARWAITCLLTLYEEGVAGFRDRIGRRSRPGRARPIRQAKELDAYLTGDGLDAATLCHDVQADFKELRWFRYGLPEYRDHVAGGPRPGKPEQLVEQLHVGLLERSARLRLASEVTTANVRASAELRQAMANTRLQRVILPLTFAAVVLALVTVIAM